MGTRIGLVDIVHQDLVSDVDLGDTYINVATSGETRRAKFPSIVPDDASALQLALSVTGTPDPAQLRIARIRNTIEPGELLVSGAVVPELRERDDVSVGELRALRLTDGDFDADPF